MERAVVLSKDDMITPQDLPENIADHPNPRSEIAIPVGMPLEEVEKTIIKETLKRSNGEKATTAKILGISTRTIYRKLGSEALKRGHGGGVDDGGREEP